MERPSLMVVLGAALSVAHFGSSEESSEISARLKEEHLPMHATDVQGS